MQRRVWREIFFIAIISVQNLRVHLLWWNIAVAFIAKTQRMLSGRDNI
jgi:hypothetical protein